MTDQITADAARDAAALVASLRRNDVDSYSLLIQFYQDDPKAQAALCGALAAFATACLKTIDKMRDHFHVTDGIVIPSGDDVIKSVILKMASEDSKS